MDLKTVIEEMIQELLREKELEETIKKIKNKYVTYPEDGGDRLGTFDTRKEAEAQLRAIEASKAQRG